LDVTSHVIYSLGLNRTIKKYTEENITLDDINRISNIILAATTDDKTTRKEHIARIQENKLNSKRVAGDQCPWCGGKLVERQGKYGKFTGSNNYPKCKFVLKG